MKILTSNPKFLLTPIRTYAIRRAYRLAAVTTTMNTQTEISTAGFGGNTGVHCHNRRQNDLNPSSRFFSSLAKKEFRRHHHRLLHERLNASGRGLKRITREFVRHQRLAHSTERVDVNEVSSVASAAASNGLVNKTQRSGQTPAADVTNRDGGNKAP